MPKKILVIDSDAPLVLTLTNSLEARGFEVVHTADGKEGLDLARQHAPDLVVLCVELPKSSGYSICSKLKKDETLRAIPVVLTSSEATPKTFEDHKRLKMGRADEYLLKPFAAEALLAKISGLIGMPAEASADEDLLDISGLAEEVAGEEPVTVEEVDEISIESDEAAPTPQHLPGDDDLAMLDAAFENLEDKDEGAHAAPVANGPAATAPPRDETDDLLSGLAEHEPDVAAHGESGAADEGEVAQLRDEIASLQKQLEASATESGRATGARDKDYFGVKEKLAQREKELLKARDELNAKDKELVEQRDREMALEQEVSRKDEEIAKRDAQQKSLQQKIDALVSGQKRSEKELSAAREEARQSTARMQAAEEKLSTLETSEAERRSGAEAVAAELETATQRVATLEEELQTERARTDELSAELHGTRSQLEEANGTVEELGQRSAELQEAQSQNEDRIVKAYQKIKGDEKLKEKVKKAVTIALQLLDEPGLDSPGDEQRT